MRKPAPDEFSEMRDGHEKRPAPAGLFPWCWLGNYGDVEAEAEAAIDGAVDGGLITIVLPPPTPNQCATANP